MTISERNLDFFFFFFKKFLRIICSWECDGHYGAIEIESVTESGGKYHRTRYSLEAEWRADRNLCYEDRLREPEVPEQDPSKGLESAPCKKQQVSRNQTFKERRRMLEQRVGWKSEGGKYKGLGTVREDSAARARQIFLNESEPHSYPWRSHWLPGRRTSCWGQAEPLGLDQEKEARGREGNCHQVLNVYTSQIQPASLFQADNGFLHFPFTPRPDFYTIYVEEPDSEGHNSGPVSGKVSVFDWTKCKMI